RLPPSLAELHPRDLHHLAVSDRALGVRGREPGANQLDQQLTRKSVREHQRLGAAVGRRGEQLKGAAAVGLGATAATVGVGHKVSGGGGSGPGGSRIPRRATFFRNQKSPWVGASDGRSARSAIDSHHCGLMLAARITFAHFSLLSTTSFPK